jgi:hypothetical protein
VVIFLIHPFAMRYLPWKLASCPKGDYTPVSYLPTSPCVLTKEEIHQALTQQSTNQSITRNQTSKGTTIPTRTDSGRFRTTDPSRTQTFVRTTHSSTHL